jgi:hypothetical protein
MSDHEKTDSEKRDATSPWPSVEEQLAEAKVLQGSALEQLIRDNQDFHLLQPGEVHDGFDIPLWLRVHFRKTHPEVQLSSVNPGASYPEALETVHRWMLAHPDLPGSSNDPTGTKGGMR